MAPLKFEIDLRSPEYQAKGKFTKTAAFRLLLYGTILLVLFFSFMALQNISRYMNADLLLLKAELAAQQEAAEPLELIIEQLAKQSRRAELEQELLAGTVIELAQVKEIYNSAPAGTAITYLAISSEGECVIRGTSGGIEEAAVFTQQLQALPFISSAALASADLNAEKVCSFSIKALIAPREGDANHGQF